MCARSPVRRLSRSECHVLLGGPPALPLPCSPLLFQKRQKLEPSRVGLERQLEEKAEECGRLQELLGRRLGEAQQSTKE